MTFALALLLAMAAVSPRQDHVVAGIVVDAKSHAPVFGAVVSLSNRVRLAVTDKEGRFRVTLPAESWPPAVIVSAPDLAPHPAALPHQPADVDLGTIPLSAAARIHLLMPRSFSGERLRWEIGKLIAGQYVDTGLRGHFAAGRTEVTVDGLEAENYAVIIRGEGPLQQIIAKASPRAGESLDLPLNVTPIALTLSVVSGEQPVSGAIVQFGMKGLRLNGRVVCDEQGKAAEEMWQPGEYFVSVLDGGRAGFTRFVRLQSDTGRIAYTFQLPPHNVKGRVVDSATMLPLTGVELTLTGTAPPEGGAEGLRVRTNEDGTFQFRAVQEGPHTLRAYLRGYRYDRPLKFSLAEDDRDYETEIAIEKIVNPHAIIVVDSAGVPVAGADMFLASAEGLLILEQTDMAGRITLPPERRGVIFAIPPAGSFAFTRLPAVVADDITLAIPPPTGAIELISQSASGEPIPNLYFMMRVNGMLIPSDVLSLFVTRHGLSFRTDQTGHGRLALLPPGLYDLYPVRTAADVNALLRGNAPQPAASVNVGSTPQVVTLTFRKK